MKVSNSRPRFHFNSLGHQNFERVRWTPSYAGKSGGGLQGWGFLLVLKQKGLNLREEVKKTLEGNRASMKCTPQF